MTSKEEDERVARAYLFALWPNFFFNNFDFRGNVWIRELFRNFRRLAWGHVCLANLYKSLTGASTIKHQAKKKGDRCLY